MGMKTLILGFVNPSIPIYVDIFILLILGIVILLVLLFKSVEKSNNVILPEEAKFWNPREAVFEEFPKPFDHLENKLVHLTVVFPAYNEQLRLPKALDETIPFLKAREMKNKALTWEIIVVDDGSRDKTDEIVFGYSRAEGTDRVRLMKLKINRGKGGAVKRGMMVGRGKYLLMADADGATSFADVHQLELKLKEIELNGYGVSVGSRAHLEDADVVRKRHFLRNLLMWGFHFLVSFIGGIHHIRDTQCGFKLFTRESAKYLFSNMNVERWCFDVELLFLASRKGIPVVEVPVNWVEIDGSKLDTFWSSIQMLRDLLRIRLSYTFGIWKTNN